ncbi:MAG: cbb3-type cytochrome c oxidase subunit I, partial [Chloroflexi bacterium]|nr:cbb3-type cytochrome c oxidase subunit I [Chloroflexota bacterium]
MSGNRGWVRHGAYGWSDYFSFNTDHKVIGVQYLVSTLLFFLYAGLLALVIRFELLDPAPTLNANTYNAAFTLHGSVMIFLFVIPVMAGFANYLIPLMIGA